MLATLHVLNIVTHSVIFITQQQQEGIFTTMTPIHSRMNIQIKGLIGQSQLETRTITYYKKLQFISFVRTRLVPRLLFQGHPLL